MNLIWHFLWKMAMHWFFTENCRIGQNLAPNGQLFFWNNQYLGETLALLHEMGSEHRIA
jgi:hypothetical protein